MTGNIFPVYLVVYLEKKNKNVYITFSDLDGGCGYKDGLFFTSGIPFCVNDMNE